MELDAEEPQGGSRRSFFRKIASLGSFAFGRKGGAAEDADAARMGAAGAAASSWRPRAAGTARAQEAAPIGGARGMAGGDGRIEETSAGAVEAQDAAAAAGAGAAVASARGSRAIAASGVTARAARGRAAANSDAAPAAAAPEAEEARGSRSSRRGRGSAAPKEAAQDDETAAPAAAAPEAEEARGSRSSRRGRGSAAPKEAAKDDESPAKDGARGGRRGAAGKAAPQDSVSEEAAQEPLSRSRRKVAASPPGSAEKLPLALRRIQARARALPARALLARRSSAVCGRSARALMHLLVAQDSEGLTRSLRASEEPSGAPAGGAAEEAPVRRGLRAKTAPPKRWSSSAPWKNSLVAAEEEATERAEEEATERAAGSQQASAAPLRARARAAPPGARHPRRSCYPPPRPRAAGPA
jgi:ribonuclease E